MLTALLQHYRSIMHFSWDIYLCFNTLKCQRQLRAAALRAAWQLCDFCVQLRSLLAKQFINYLIHTLCRQTHTHTHTHSIIDIIIIIIFIMCFMASFFFWRRHMCVVAYKTTIISIFNQFPIRDGNVFLKSFVVN